MTQTHGNTHGAPAAMLQRWAAPFVAVALVGQLSAVALPGTRSWPAFLASCGVLVAVVALTWMSPRLGLASWIQLLAPCGYLIALALLFKSQNNISTGLQSLVLLPIAWVALYHRARESALLVLIAVGMVAVTSWLDHVPAVVIARGAGLWGLTGAIIVLGAHNLRRWLGDAIHDREEALRQAELLGDVARELNSTLDPESVVATAVRRAAEIASPPGLRARRANYCRISDGVVRVDAEFDAEGEYVGANWRLWEHPLLARAVQERVVTSGALDPAQLGPTVRELASRQGVGHGAWVPVIVAGDLHGVLAVAGRNRPLADHEVARCIAIVRIMELALANALAHEHSQRAAHTDPLTSLANRRALHQMVRDRRGRRPLAVLAIDVDGLKDVNDRYGHAAGDELLLVVADAIGSVLRSGDVLARVGGDEFACVVFDSDRQEGAYVAERILDAVLNTPYPRRAPRVSIGVTCAEPGASLDHSVRQADAAMYEAKRAGGMRYRVAGTAVPTGEVDAGA